MQFLNIGGGSQLSSNRATIDSNTTQQQPKDKQEHNILRLTSIEKQLNTLCCHHDSLMPLLELNNYQSVCYRWENSLKSINKKLGDYQAYVMGLGGEESRSYGVEQREVQNGKIITLNKIKQNIEQIKSKLGTNSRNYSPILSEFNPQAQLVQSLYEPLNNKQSEPFTTLNPLTQLQQQSAQSLQDLKKYINISLALFKNQLILSESENPSESYLNSSTNQKKSKQITQNQQESVQKFTQNIFKDVKKQIQYLRNNLQVQDIRDFHQKSMERLSCDIAEIQDMLDIFLEEEAEERKNWVKELTVIEEKIKLIGWQIKGMRKKYFFQINNMYSVEKDTFEVNVFEKLVQKDLQLLENAFKQVRIKLDQIKSSNF